jgi:hypothetical protein
MVGDDRVRFCVHCKKDVYDLSALQRDEAEALLAERSGGMCARLYRRTDGTVLTADCPTGVRRKRRRLAIAGAVGGGLLAASALRVATPVQGAIGPSARAMGSVALPIRQVPEATEPPIGSHMMGGLMMGETVAPIHASPPPRVPASSRTNVTR